MQRQQRLAQVRDRVAHHLLRPRDPGAAGRGLDQLLVRRQEALQGVVVDQLRDAPPRPVLGVHHLRDELPPVGTARTRPPSSRGPQLRDLGPELGFRSFE